MKRRGLAAIGLCLLAALLLGACGLKTEENEYVTTLEGRWDGAKDFSEGYAAVKKDGKWGFINTDGTVVISPQYDDARSFSEGCAAVRKGGSWTFIDNEGKSAVPGSYSYVSSFYEGRAVYGEGIYYGYIDREGKRVTDPIYTEASRYREGFACVRQKDGGYGFLNADGTPVTEFVYGIETRFSEGLAAVFYSKATNGVNTGYINPAGETALPFDWYDGKAFSEGYAAVQKTYPGTWGYIDKQGNEVIASAWDSAENFSRGRALVEKDRKFRFIDTAGNPVGDAAYDKAYPFTDDGLARVGEQSGLGYRFGFIKTDGSALISPEYDNAMDFHNGYAAVCKGEKWGFLRADGTVVTGFLWTDVGEMTPDGLATVRTDDVYGFIKLK